MCPARSSPTMRSRLSRSNLVKSERHVTAVTLSASCNETQNKRGAADQKKGGDKRTVSVLRKQNLALIDPRPIVLSRLFILTLKV